MDRQNPITIKQVVKTMIAQLPHKHKLEEARIIDAWHRVLPAIVQRRTVQMYVKGGKIFIKVNSAPLRQTLEASKESILAQLRLAIEDTLLTDIIFTV